MQAVAATLYWTQSGTAKIHFAPSGDMFLEAANGRVERISWRDGDGLGPLRFSELSVDRDCGTPSECKLEFAGHTIQLRGEAGPPEAWVSRTATSASVPLIVKWDQIKRANGITLVRTSAGFELKQKPDCGSRAWRICRLDE